MEVDHHAVVAEAVVSIPAVLDDEPAADALDYPAVEGTPALVATTGAGDEGDREGVVSPPSNAMGIVFTEGLATRGGLSTG